MMKFWTHSIFAILGGVVILAVPAKAQTQISSSVIGAGGGVMTGGGLVMVGTLGQSVIGPTSDATLTLSQGFWYTLPRPATNSVREEYTNGQTGESVVLMQNAPNPFSQSTDIRVQIPQRGPVSLRLYDALGRLVRTLIDGEREAGEITVRMDADELESGRYTAQLIAAGARRAITMVVVK